MNKFYRSIIFGMALATSVPLFAASPRLPEVTTKGYINGKMNIAVWHKDIAYTDSKRQDGAKLTCSYQIEMKSENESQWVDVTNKGVFNDYEKNRYLFKTWAMATNYFGSAHFRIRSVDNDTASEWVDLGSFKASMNVVGTPIFADGCNGFGFDGYLNTMVDASGNSGNQKYIGYVFDEPTRIKAIRFVPRLDHLALANRYRGSVFQIASDESFSDAETIYTVSSDFENIDITEVVFDEPITAKAIRHYKEIGGLESTAELEFIPVDMPIKPTLSVVVDDIKTYNPKVQWSFPELFLCSTCRLERAISKSGPWVPQTEWLDPSVDELSFVGKDLYVGITYFYRVVAVTEHPDFKDEYVYSKIVDFTRLRRLDRSWEDQTKLYDGITVMVGTNGSALISVPHRKAAHVFDGDPSTFADLTQSWNCWGPIGLDFGEKVWVKEFGYICRNDNTCYSRIRLAALFSSDSEDHELNDKVQRSETNLPNSQDTTFYTCKTTSLPLGGARKWFLYATREDTDRFYGNVAELAFFGWTNDDIAAAPLVVAPSDISFSRGVNGPIISWNDGNNVQRYILKRRLRGLSEWTVVAELQKTVYSYTDENLEQGVYEYCIDADGGESVVTSNIFTYPWYIAGNGEGLSSSVIWSYNRTSILPVQMTSSASLGNGNVNFSLNAQDEIISGVSSDARIVWEGKLIVPFDGLYTFSADAIGGAAVAVDNTFAFNSWTDGIKSLSGDLLLTAGEHSIRVDYRTDSDASRAKKFILKWSGSVQEEIIPLSQLLPSTTPPSCYIDDWKCLSYNMDRVGQFVKANDGRYIITSSTESVGENPLRAAFMNKMMQGSYSIEALVTRGNADGIAGIMIQDKNGYYIMPYIEIKGADTWYGVKAYSPESESWSHICDRVQFGNMSNHDSCLRIEKRSGEVKCFWKDNVGNDWTEIATYKTPVGMFGFETFAGLAVHGNHSSQNPAQFVFNNIDVKEIETPTLIMLK
jgi:hypothetical protein